MLSLVDGFVIFMFGSGYFVPFPTNNNPLYLASLSALFLLVAVILRPNPRLEKSWRATYCVGRSAVLYSHGAFHRCLP